MQLSVVIVNYNTFELTCQCIRSFREQVTQVEYEVIVVDNASPGEDPDEFKVIFPWIKLVKNHENDGFAKGNNLGIRHAKGNIILLLNSDTYLTEDCISQPLSRLAGDPKLGALSVRIIYPDGKFQHTARRFRSIRNELLDLCRPLLYLMPYRRRAKLMLNQYFNGDFDTECDWVSGAFLMFPKRILEALPEQKLDERFFMYGEDELWCLQFRELGYRNYFFSGTSVVHIANASTEPAKQLRLLKTMIDHELVITAHKHGRGFYYFTFRVIFCTKEYGRYYIKLLLWRVLGKKLR